MTPPNTPTIIALLLNALKYNMIVANIFQFVMRYSKSN